LSPGTDPRVINAGASTQFRAYAQNNLGVQPLATGDLNNNVSAFSSGGVSRSGKRTVDALAPGDSSWALCSTNVALYEDCYNDATPAGLPSSIEIFGGTSESSPLIAGETERHRFYGRRSGATAISVYGRSVRAHSRQTSVREVEAIKLAYNRGE
jgi:hypothetical protein